VSVQTARSARMWPRLPLVPGVATILARRNLMFAFLRADARLTQDKITIAGATIQAITERASGITFMVVIHKAPSDSRLRPQ
jgi:hypothetical protein